MAVLHELVPIVFGMIKQAPEEVLAAVPCFSSYGRLDDYLRCSYGNGNDKITIETLAPASVGHNIGFVNVSAHAWKGDLTSE